MKKELFYDPNKMLSYNRILNFVISNRGYGKSFGLKKFSINRFIKNNEQFIYVRRFRSELKKVKNFFNDIMMEFPSHEFKVKGKEFWIDGKLAGYAIPLSTWQSEKSNAYPMVTTIIFDEFIREKDNSGYIPNEVDALLNLMDTVFRNRDNVRCVCLSNAVTIVNPYFVYFKLMPNIEKRFNAYEDLLIEIVKSEEFIQERVKTRFGRLVNGTQYGEMAIDNDFVNDSKVFIEKRTKESRFQFSIIYKGMTIGVWVDPFLGLMYLSNDHDPSARHKIALTKDDLDENTMLFTGWRNNYYLTKLVRAFVKGYLRFDNQVLRNIGYEIFQKMHVQ